MVPIKARHVLKKASKLLSTESVWEAICKPQRLLQDVDARLKGGSEDKLAAATKATEKHWVKHMGKLKHLRRETTRINRIIEEASEQIDVNILSGLLNHGIELAMRTGLREWISSETALDSTRRPVFVHGSRPGA